MQVDLTVRHFKAPDNLKTYAEREIQTLNKIFDRILDCHVILDRGKEGDKVDLNLNISGKTFSAADTSDDMKKSVDYAVQKMQKQLLRYKQRQQH